MYTYKQYVIIRNNLRKALEKWSEVLQSFPKGAMGLVPDAVRATPEYKTAKTAYDSSFHTLRVLNGKYVKQYKKELAADRKIALQEHFDSLEASK